MFLLIRGLQLILIWFRLSPGVIWLPICLMWPKGLMEMDISMLLSSSKGFSVVRSTMPTSTEERGSSHYTIENIIQVGFLVKNIL